MTRIQNGILNPMWKGDNVSYRVLHKWVHRHSSIPKVCFTCKRQVKLEASNISGKYLRDLTDWEWLCRKCHMIKDGRLEKLHNKETEEKITKIQRLPENREKRRLLVELRFRNEQGRFI